MTGEKRLIQELKKSGCVCYYPSSGTDLSDVDYFCSGRKPREERIGGRPEAAGSPENPIPGKDPDLFIHTDINFYREFGAGPDLPAQECGIHAGFEILEYRELPSLESPNRISDNYDHSGRCFEYRFRAWGSGKIKTLIYCLCENESFVSRILLDGGLDVPFVWSRNWAGGRTHGTWLANVLDRLHTEKVYTDWLCVPGGRGEPRNLPVEKNYPELMVPSRVKLVRNDDVHWIEEGAHGWVEEFDVVAIGSTEA